MLHKQGIQANLEAQKNNSGINTNNGPDKSDDDHKFAEDNNNSGDSVVQARFLVDGLFSFVPKMFEFPSCNVEEELSFWFQGQSVSSKRRIWPHCKFNCRHALPTKELKENPPHTGKHCAGSFLKI